MGRNKQKGKVIEDVEFTSYAALGKALARPEGKVLFAEWAVPGDVADVVITKDKKNYSEGRVIKYKKLSADRIQPVCRHFGFCGGCKWQMLPYEKQLENKQNEVISVFHKEGIDVPVLPVIGSEKIYQYRNKLEFTFSDREFLPAEQFKEGVKAGPALGYHMPKMFDKVLNITECHLMDGINDKIRNGLRDFAIKNGFTFYNVHSHEGWMRNLIIRYATTGECMVNLVVAFRDDDRRRQISEFLSAACPEITTLLFTINPKLNDTIYDLQPEIVYGPGVIYENLSDLKFKISPKSFFQTNTVQAERLYQVAQSFAGLTGHETVYDLYCGTGSIGMFLHRNAAKIVGVEVVEDAIKDARENAALNRIGNASFYTGDVIKVCNDSFFEKNGKPDVVILDPPRPGIHPSLAAKLLEIRAPKIVYVSCNIITQARDLNLLKKDYVIKRLQPVDMFPQTFHIECVAELDLAKID